MKPIPRNDIQLDNCRIRKGVSFFAEWRMGYYRSVIFLFVRISNSKTGESEFFRFKQIPISRFDGEISFSDLVKLCKETSPQQATLNLRKVFELRMRDNLTLKFQAPGYKKRASISVSCTYSDKRCTGFRNFRPLGVKGWWKKKAKKFFVLDW